MRNLVDRALKSACVVLVAGLAACAPRLASEPVHTGSVAAQIRADLAADTSLSVRPLDVHDAVARTLIHNQELRSERLARLLAEADAGLATAEMLPEVVASSQVYARSNVAATSSASAAAPTVRGGYAVGSERVSRSRDLSMSWNVLDFGVSYFRARQAAHKAQIAAEQQRRTTAVLIEETRVAFWQALALQRLDAGLTRLDGEMARAIADAGRLRAAGLTDPVEALSSERDLLSVRRELDQQRKGLVGADLRLRALMNFPETAPLVLVDRPAPTIPAVGRASFGSIAEAVLVNRPEIRQAALEQRITAEEARIALLELVPNLQLVLGDQLDQNPFLLNQGWVSLASRASWQIVKLLQYPAKSQVIAGQGDLARQRTRALAIAVILQAEVALARLDQVQREHRTLVDLARVQRRLATQVEIQSHVGRSGAQVATLERMNALLAEARRDAVAGEVQGAHAAVLTSFGFDLADADVASGRSVDEVAAGLRAAEAAAFGRAAGAVRIAGVAPGAEGRR